MLSLYHSAPPHEAAGAHTCSPARTECIGPVGTRGTLPAATSANPCRSAVVPVAAAVVAVEAVALRQK